jgi:hypothetical protein
LSAFGLKLYLSQLKKCALGRYSLKFQLKLFGVLLGVLYCYR